MPLPPALAARLAKRGILQNADVNSSKAATPKTALEDIKTPDEVQAQSLKEKEELSAENKLKGYNGCPNKWNPYHVCAPFCLERWTEGQAQPDAEYERRRQKMLLVYPVPDGWQEVYDPGTGRHFYWSLESDRVSWFPPGHPKAIPVVAAAQVRQNLANVKPLPDKEMDKEIGCEERTKEVELRRMPDLYREVELRKIPDPFRDIDERPKMVEPYRDVKEAKTWPDQERVKAKTKQRVKFSDSGPLDPMDPASYSDIPRGSWSTGLTTGDEAKTGVDSTASGPLFQQRPYPSPGAILRANAASKDS